GHQAGLRPGGANAMRHADPQRGVVVSGPGAPRQGHRRESVVVEGTRFDPRGADELHAAVREAALCHGFSDGLYAQQSRWRVAGPEKTEPDDSSRPAVEALLLFRARVCYKRSFIGRSSRRNGSNTRPNPSSVVAPSNGASPGSPTIHIESPRLPSYSNVAVASRR